MRRSIPTAILVLLFAGSVASEALAREGRFFAAQINYFVADVEGTGRTQGDLATDFDFADTLGIVDDDKVPEATIWFNFGNSSFMLSYYATKYDGTNILSDDLVFEDMTFPVGIEIESGLELALARLHYNYRFIDSKWLDLAVVVGADLYSVEANIMQVGGGLQEDAAFNAPFPVVGVNLAVKPALGLRLFLEASGSVLDFGDIDASVLDAQARLTWYIMDGPFGISVGARYLDVDLQVEDEGEGNVRQTGYSGGIAVRF